jgi:hypothetical protein
MLLIMPVHWEEQMTEHEWLTGSEPEHMLQFVRDKVSHRKVRLFASASCRRLWHLLNRQGRQAVDMAEQCAEKSEIIVRPYARLQREIRNQGAALGNSRNWYLDTACLSVITGNLSPADITTNLRIAAYWAGPPGYDGPSITARYAGREKERAGQVTLLRDIIDNPFSTVSLDSSILSWHDGTVVQLARAIYDDCRFEDMPVLADALEEAGCTDESILRHCRSGLNHVRGCYVVDALLGKQ